MTKPAPEKIQSVRLTEEMRNEIVRALIENKLAKREEAYDKAQFRLALRIYQNQFSPADRRKMDALPEGWLPTKDNLRAKVGNDWFHLSFSAVVDRRREEKRFPAKCERVFEYEPRSEIGIALREFAAEGAAIKDARRELTAKANGVLASVTTTARLAEVWPEVVPFIPKHVPRLLPVVRREELNAAFGLSAA